MNRFGVLIVFQIVMCLGARSAAEAATYYASRTGNDGYSCSQAQSPSTPKQTLNSAAGCLSAGDTLLVRGGTYVESLNNNAVPSGTSWSMPVRIAAYSGETVWLAPNDLTHRVLEFGGSQHYIVFDGLNLDGSRAMETVKINAGSPGADAHHIRIMNAEVLGPAMNPYRADGPTGQTILATAGDTSAQGGNEFINLTIHSGGQNDFDQVLYIQSPGNLVERCNIYDFPGNAVQIYNGNGLGAQANGNVIRRNVIHDTRVTQQGQRHAGIVTTWNNNVVYDNVIYNIHTSGSAAVGISVYEGSNNTGVYNNTIFGADGEGLTVDPNAFGTVVRNNISYNNAGGNYRSDNGGTIQDHNLFGTNPMFVSASAGNFQLQAGSPAIDAGMTISTVTTDMIATPRPQGGAYDIGAFEYGSQTVSAPVAPPAPTGVRILTQ